MKGFKKQKACLNVTFCPGVTLLSLSHRPTTTPGGVVCCALTAEGDILTPGDDARYSDKLLFKALVGLRQLFPWFLPALKFLLSERCGVGGVGVVCVGGWGGGVDWSFHSSAAAYSVSAAQASASSQIIRPAVHLPQHVLATKKETLLRNCGQVLNN